MRLIFLLLSLFVLGRASVNPFLAYLKRKPGHEFAKRQFEFYKASFLGLVDGATPDLANRLETVVMNLIDNAANYNIAERDIYILGHAMLSPADLGVSPYMFKEKELASIYAITSISIRVYWLTSGTIDLLGSGSLFESTELQHLWHRFQGTTLAFREEIQFWTYVNSFRDYLSDPEIPHEEKSQRVGFLEFLREMRMNLIATVGGYSESECIIKSFTEQELFRETTDFYPNAKRVLENISQPVINILKLINSRRWAAAISNGNHAMTDYEKQTSDVLAVVIAGENSVQGNEILNRWTLFGKLILEEKISDKRKLTRAFNGFKQLTTGVEIDDWLKSTDTFFQSFELAHDESPEFEAENMTASFVRRYVQRDDFAACLTESLATLETPSIADRLTHVIQGTRAGRLSGQDNYDFDFALTLAYRLRKNLGLNLFGHNPCFLEILGVSPTKKIILEQGHIFSYMSIIESQNYLQVHPSLDRIRGAKDREMIKIQTYLERIAKGVRWFWRHESIKTWRFPMQWPLRPSSFPQGHDVP